MSQTGYGPAWHTTIRRSKFPEFTIKLFIISFKLGFSSGIRELIDAQFYGSFHLCKVKISCLKNLAQFCQVRCQCWQNESSMFKFFVFITRNETTHIASFLFSDSCFSAAQIAKTSHLALTAASLDNHLVLNARCNCLPFVISVVWCIGRQSDHHGETEKHFHNCNKVFSQFVLRTTQICGRIVRGRTEAVPLTMHRYLTYNCSHGRNLVGTRGRVPPLFQPGGT